MLEGIFGNKNAEKVLLHLFHYGSIHAAAVAADYGVAVTPLKKQLQRFEASGVLVSKEVGRTRVYSFNPKSPYVKPLKELLSVFYSGIPLEERQKIFAARRRPREAGKPVLR